MEAMEYEYLLRRVYDTGRSYENGADADIYRSMETAYNNLTTKSLFSDQDQREYDFRTKFSKVRIHVDDAIAFGLKQIKYKATLEEVKKIEAMSGTLTYKFFDKEKLDKIIDEANEIFQAHGLEA